MNVRPDLVNPKSWGQFITSNGNGNELICILLSCVLLIVIITFWIRSKEDKYENTKLR